MDFLAGMQIFVSVVDRGSLSAAARAQRQSPAAVSRQISALEKDLGAPLLSRTTRKLSLTVEGRRFYDHAVRLLADVARARESVGGGGGPSGTVTVSAGITIGLRFVVPRLAPLLAAHPKLDVEVRLEDRVVDLVGDGVDVAVRGGIAPPDSASLMARPLLSFPRVLVASPGYLKRAKMPKDPCDLVRHVCLVQTGVSGPMRSWTLVTAGGEERVVRVGARMACHAPIALRDAARDGAGIALLGDWLVERELASGELVRVLPRWETPKVTVWAIYRVEARESATVRAVVGALAGQEG